MMKKIYVIFLIFSVASISMMTSTITAFHSNITKDDQSLCVKEQRNNYCEYISNISSLEEDTLSEITPIEHLRNECIFRYIGFERFEKIQAQKNKDIYGI